MGLNVGVIGHWAIGSMGYGIAQSVFRAGHTAYGYDVAPVQQFLAVSGVGYGGEDDAAVAKIYARNSNLTLPDTKD